MTENNLKNNPYLSDKLLEALEFASLAHNGQVRKGSVPFPYFSHPAAVGIVLTKADFPEHVVIAGILHDVIEDTKYGYKDIADRFGEAVAELVQNVSEDKSLEFADRKRAYNDHLKEASQEALAISAADFLCNRKSMEIAAKIHGSEEARKILVTTHMQLQFGKERLQIISERLDHPLVKELVAVCAATDLMFDQE